MESITLQRVLPCVFAGEAAPRDSGVWSQEVTFRKGEYCLLEAASGTGKTSLCHFLYGIRKLHNLSGYRHPLIRTILQKSDICFGNI